MNLRFLLILVFIFYITGVDSQSEAVKKVELTGVVTDYDNKPIKGARIFVDSLKTKVKTNKKGIYKIKVSQKNRVITVFSVDHGVIDIDYTGQNKINFIFPENTRSFSKKEFSDLGYGTSSYDQNEVDYSSYTDIFQLLKTKFPNLQVVGETIRIRGTGTTINGGQTPPLFIVNGSQVSNIASISPSDIKSIKIERANTSLYGSQGAGGIIKIKLKE
ncbi:MAG: TonB-dependent receptor plug domain-containing protein [Flavobacteriaceae bacterium]|nr:TonB-dependent receptor plug domain-containing protein [Flavobacteriaceae bacterium]